MKEEHGYKVEAAIILDPASADNRTRSEFYKMYNRDDHKSVYKLKQRKITEVYCDPKFIGTFCTHICAVFIEDAD
eukprot:575942-Ditylum_brightwellii.AAC.2